MHNPWGIYVHVPWCRRRCPYCDFYFEVGRAEDGFVTQVLEEYAQRRIDWPKHAASTLYFGGGTPSLLKPEAISHAIAGFDLQSDAEITLEVNPEDVDSQVVGSWKESGINRVSLGIQSFDDSILNKLGRKHRAQEAWRALELCIGAIPCTTVDLIYGVPGENAATIEESVRRLRAMGVGHVSAYLLTVESGTALERHIKSGRTPAPDDDHQADAYEHVQRVMADAGFAQYEVSSFALAGQESRHNRNYWSKGEYLGVGPAAHSMRVLADGSVERSHSRASLREWQLKAAPLCEVLEAEDALLEAIAFGLRDLQAGIKIGDLEARHKCAAPSQLMSALTRSEARGWVSSHEGVWRLTQIGVRFADAVARDILAVKG